MAYGARLESVLGASPRGFESPILRSTDSASHLDSHRFREGPLSFRVPNPVLSAFDVASHR